MYVCVCVRVCLYYVYGCVCVSTGVSSYKAANVPVEARARQV